MMGLFSWLHDGQIEGYQESHPSKDKDNKLTGNLLDDLIEIKRQSGNTADMIYREIEVSGIKTALIMCEGLFNTQLVIEGVVEPLMQYPPIATTPETLLGWIRQQAVMAPDQKELYTFGELFEFVMSGFVVILVDGLTMGVALGLQGFSFRSISEPSSEVNVKGSREGFVEALRINVSMLRRRVKSPTLKVEYFNVGTRSTTAACLVYFSDIVPDKMLEKIRYKLSKVTMEMVLDSGQIQPFLASRPLSIFSGTGSTERPDTLAAKLGEGRVGILLDGSPFALIVPYLLVEHFQSFDDYIHRPYFALFVRMIKYMAFFVATLLPGMYVAVVKFHPELLPKLFLFNVAAASKETPFPILLEMLLINLMYEIMREAGLRMPRPIGHAVSLVGGLVIGDAAVRAGIVGAPIVIIVAVTAISAFVLPSLYDVITLLRFGLIIVGGIWGAFGLTLALAMVFISMCSVEVLGIPLTTTASPISLYGLRDTFFRLGWRRLQERRMVVDQLPGSDIHSGGGMKDE